MSESKRTNYESAALEILLFNAKDVIATSGFGEKTDYVDSETNSWVTPGTGGWN